MPSFSISGRLDSTPSAPDLTAGLAGVAVEPRHSASLQRARAGEPVQTIAAAADDLVELELEDGLRLWMRADDVADDFGLVPARDGMGAFAFPNQLPVAGRSRGVGEWVIKGLKVFGVDIAGTITDFVASHVEGRLAPGPGLYRCTAGPATEWLPVNGALEGGPVLLFLHGTASSTAGSFGALWEGGATARIHQLLTRYQGRVLALQHRTLTESPIQNALAAVEKLAAVLPKNSEIHLVSHSRGGLVGELLARGERVGGPAFDGDDLRLFADANGRDVEALKELNAALGAVLPRPLRPRRLSSARHDPRGRPARPLLLLLTNIVGQIPAVRALASLRRSPQSAGGRSQKAHRPREELLGLEAMSPGRRSP